MKAMVDAGQLTSAEKTQLIEQAQAKRESVEAELASLEAQAG